MRSKPWSDYGQTILDIFPLSAISMRAKIKGGEGGADENSPNLSLLLLAMFMAGVLAGRLLDSTSGKLLGADEVVQIGIVVKDIEKASRTYAEILGTEVPPWFLTDTVDKAHTWFRGQPSEARAKLSFIKLKNITP